LIATELAAKSEHDKYNLNRLLAVCSITIPPFFDRPLQATCNYTEHTVRCKLLVTFHYLFVKELCPLSFSVFQVLTQEIQRCLAEHPVIAGPADGLDMFLPDEPLNRVPGADKAPSGGGIGHVADREKLGKKFGYIFRWGWFDWFAR